jgi:hypothetical protein
MPYRKWTPREKGKKDEVPDIARDTAFEPSVVLKMLQALRTEMFPVEGRQEDAEEFLSFILNRMNDEMIEVFEINQNQSSFKKLRLFIAKKACGKAKNYSKKRRKWR